MIRSIAVACLLLAACGSSQPAAQPKAGSAGGAPPARSALADLGPAVAGTIYDTSGGAVELAALYQQQNIGLIFYLGSWCAHCRKQLAQIQAEAQQVEAKGLHLIGLSVDPAEDSIEFAHDIGLSFPLYEDRDGAVIKQWGLWNEEMKVAVPATAVVKKGGTLVFHYVGKNIEDRPPPAKLLEIADALR